MTFLCDAIFMCVWLWYPLKWGHLVLLLFWTIIIAITPPSPSPANLMRLFQTFDLQKGELRHQEKHPSCRDQWNSHKSTIFSQARSLNRAYSVKRSVQRNRIPPVCCILADIHHECGRRGSEVEGRDNTTRRKAARWLCHGTRSVKACLLVDWQKEVDLA